MNKYIISDVKINIRDLTRYVTGHWVSVVVITVLAACAFAGYKAAPLLSGSEGNVPADAESLYDRDMGYYDLDVGTVKDNFSSIQTYFEGERAYVNNSIFLQIDPYNICDTMVQYEISSEGNSALAIATYLGNMAIGGGEYLDPVAASFGTESVYIKELIRATCNSNPQSLDFVYSEAGVAVNEINSYDQADSVILTIETMGTTREMSEAIMDAVEAQIDQADSEYAGNTSYTLTKLSRVYQVTASDVVSNSQFLIYDRFEKIADILNSYKKQATTEIVRPAMSDYTSARAGADRVSVKTIVKYGLTGAFLGFVLSAAVYILIYTMSGKLITEDRFKTMYKVNVLGTDEDMISASIRNYAKDAKKILISGRSDCNALALSLSSNMPDIQFIPAGDILGDPAARAKLADCDGVILTETIGSSRYEDITGQLDLICASGKEVIGAVIR